MTIIAVADTIDELVELANKSDYTLAAAVWTKDVNLALDVAGRIRSGTLAEMPQFIKKSVFSLTYSSVP